MAEERESANERMTYECIDVQISGRVTRVTMNRPDQMNSINPAMHYELQSAFDEFADDDSQFLCVLTGAGARAFCAGSDLKADWSSFSYPENGYAGLIERFDLNKPIIAAVNGACMGGGFEMALACDLIIAADCASFALPEPRVGAIALAGGIHRLTRQLPLKRAMGFLLTGSTFSAEDAYTLGLVNEVAPSNLLDAVVERWCEEILKCAPMSVRATKEAAMRGFGEGSVEAALQAQADYPAYRAWIGADDNREGVRAFAEKRDPVWKGR